MSRVFEPLSPSHPLVRDSHECPGCERPFQVGDRTVLVTIGPGDDPEARQRAHEGRPYNAVAIPVHAGCAGLA